MLTGNLQRVGYEKILHTNDMHIGFLKLVAMLLRIDFSLIAHLLANYGEKQSSHKAVTKLLPTTCEAVAHLLVVKEGSDEAVAK